MIGFDAIGQGSLGELTGGDDAIIFAPGAASVAVTQYTPFATAGKSAAPSNASIVASVATAKVLSGTRIAPPTANVAASVVAGGVYISATVTLSGSAVAASRSSPAVYSGATVKPTTTPIPITTATPIVRGGKSAFPPSVSVTANSSASKVSISATEQIPPTSVIATTSAPQVVTGNIIEASNTVTMLTPYGEVASTSIGEFAIGEGTPSTRVVKQSPLILVSVGAAPAVLAGKQIKPSFASVIASSSAAEIDSRRRKLRVFAIAS